MSRVQALLRLASALPTDQLAFAELLVLLEEQFQAALRHQGEELKAVAERITEKCAELEASRSERVSLVEALVPAALDGSERVVAALRLLPAPHAEAAERAWAQLEKTVRECKRLNERNCALLMDQYELMQSVLAPEGKTYDPR